MDMLTWKGRGSLPYSTNLGFLRLEEMTFLGKEPLNGSSQSTTKGPELIHINTGNVTKTEQVVFMY